MQSPGHQKFPDHQVREARVDGTVKVSFKGTAIAESASIIQVTEDKAPVRYYFPRADVRMERLQPTDTTTECPFKGTASYFNLEADGKLLKDAVWSYQAPYDEHADLAQRVAFYDDKYPEITVKVEG